MSSGTSTPGSGPKPMSSRLLTMKFMQRAAASSPNTPSPSGTDEPSPKRQKRFSSLADSQAIKAAFAEEEAKRQAALDRAATESGDTRWVLSFEDQDAGSVSPILALRVVQTGYANLDAPSSFKAVEEDMEEDKPAMIGRRSFGKFNKALEKKQNGEKSDSDSENDDDDDDDDDESDGDSVEDDPTSELIRTSRHEATKRVKEERRVKKLAEKAESQKMAKKRKKTEVKLNGLTSLSGRQNTFKGACFTCGGPHPKKDCPQAHKRGYQGGEDDGPPRKAIKSR